jgi:hypothetical protein
MEMLRGRDRWVQFQMVTPFFAPAFFSSYISLLILFISTTTIIIIVIHASRSADQACLLAAC